MDSLAQVGIVAHALALLALLLAGAAVWLLSILLRDVSIVDIFWGPMFLLVALVHWLAEDSASARANLMLVLVAVWSLRLAGYLAWRNWGQEEDRRYQRIRAAYEPGFWWKSLYIVFALQAVLAWVVSLPFAAGMHAPNELGFLAGLGLAVWSLGLFFEAVGDLQLGSFKRDEANRGRIMDRGLWRYTRHPNYFGDFCVWWGFYLIALDGGGWWSFVGPLLMTVLLLRVSGVSMLERTMRKRPEYAEYMRRTSAFFPWPPRSA